MKYFKTLLCLTVILGGLFISSCKKDDLMRDDYPTLAEKHIIKKTTGKEVVKRLDNKETFLIVLGFPRCPWCQAIMNEINLAAKELKVKEVLYLDIYDMRENETSPDRSYYLRLEESFKDAIDVKHNRLNAPTFIGVKNGNLVGYNIDTVPSHKLTEAMVLPPLTEEEQTELKNILQEIIRKTF